MTNNSNSFRYQRLWCSGIMQDSHSCDPGSIPGGRSLSNCIRYQRLWCSGIMQESHSYDLGSIPGGRRGGYSSVLEQSAAVQYAHGSNPCVP